MIQVLRKFRILPLILGALMVTQVGTAHAAIQIVANDAQQVFVDRQVVGFPKIEKNQGGNTFDLVSHGRPGELLIDGEWKDASKIVAFLKFQIAPQTKHINIYGCEFAKGEKGMQAIAYIEKALGVSIAASNNITGKDGDWTLEVGQVLTAITVSNYQGNLQNLVNNGSFSGSASGWSLSGASYIGWSNHDQMMNLNEGNGNYNGSGEQYINTIVGNTYTITFDAHNHKTSTYSSDWDQTFNLTLGSSTQSITVPAQGGNHGFIGYSRTFTATSTSTLIKFQHAGTNSVEHDILIDNVSIAYVAPPCNAGNTPPALSSTTATNLCPAIGVNLNSYVTNVGSKNLVWYTNNTHTGSPITYSSSANAGTYYAFFYDAVNNCYSPVSSPLTVTINACTFTSPSCAIFNYIQNPSFEQYTSCPSTGLINSLQTNAKYWSNVGTAELMIVNSTCAAGNPTASSGTGVWSGATLIGGHTGAAWAGFHGGERAVDTLVTTLQPGTYTITFWAGYATDNQGIYTSGSPMGVYNSAGTLLGSSAVVSNHLTSTNQTWQQYSITFTTTVATNTLQFGSTGAGYLYIDDVVLWGAPIFSVSNASNLCPATTVNLNSYVTNAGLNNLVWFTNNTHTGTAITNSGSVGAGTYYAFFYDAVNNCYSPVSSPLTVTINSCTPTTPSTCGNINYFKNPSFECYNLCPADVSETRITNTVCGWLDAGYADPQFFVYNPGGACIENTFYGSNASSLLTGGHTGNAWMGIANSNFQNFSTMHPLMGVLEAPLQPGTYTLKFWAGRLNTTSWFNNPVVKIYGMDSLHQHPWTTGFYGEVTGTINPTLGTVTVTNVLDNVTNNWQQYSITFTTTKVFKSLVMYHQTTNGYMMVDDFELLAADPYCCDVNSNNKGMYCDYDGDNILNWQDLDDDNDGILDAVENPSCFYSASEVNANYPTFATTAQNITTGLINLGSFTSIFNAFDGNTALAPTGSGYSNYATFQSYQTWGGKSLFNWNYNTPIPVTGFTMLSSTSIPRVLGSAGSTIMLMGSIDGYTWLQMSQPVAADVSTTIVLNNTLQPNTAFKYYKIIGVVGSTGATDVCGSIVEVVPNVNTTLYIPSSNPKPNCTSPLDTDNDGIANMFDLDSDADGCPDALEGGAAITKASLVYSNTMNGGSTGITSTLCASNTCVLSNGVPTIAGVTGQTIGSAINSTVKDASCLITCADTMKMASDCDFDGDGITNSVDLDDDNDGIPDSKEGNGTVDTDSDGMWDSFDLDADNDGIPDLYESGLTKAQVLELDINNDGVIDVFFPVGPNGIANIIEIGNVDGGVTVDLVDYNNNGTADLQQNTDGDSIPDWRDVDTDNDGISDLIEGGTNPNFDLNKDGRIDNLTDVDHDGILDAVDDNTTLLGGLKTNDIINSDNDITDNFRDLDSDNDGRDDIDETILVDANRDGLVDTIGQLTSYSTLVNINGDLIPDYLQPSNPFLAAQFDMNADKVIDSEIDTDGDGIMDVLDGLPNIFKDAAPKPDISPVIYLTPSDIIGDSRLRMVINVKEVGGDITGDTIIVFLKKEPAYSFVYNPTATVVGGVDVENATWVMTQNATHYIFKRVTPINPLGYSKIGLLGDFTLPSNIGSVVFEVALQYGSGLDSNTTNNTDKETLNYRR